MGSQQKVDPNCINASNPFHACGDRCRRSHNSKPFIKGGKSPVAAGTNGGRVIVAAGTNGGRVTESVHVDPHCINASNPFHQCTNSCGKRTIGVKKHIVETQKAQHGEVNRDIIRKVDPSCVNASNPFHHCTERCSQKTHGAKR